MGQVDLAALGKQQIDEAVELFLDAFRTEAFTATWLDLTQPKLRMFYRHVVRLKFELSLAAGHPIRAALLNGQVIAFAVVKSPHLKYPIGWIIRSIPKLIAWFCRLARLLPALLPYFPRAAHLAKAVKAPAVLPEIYYTLEILAVHPAYQNRGLGQMLLEDVERLARRDHGASGIYLLTGDEKNRYIYEKASYQVAQTRPARGFTAYHMFLPLK